MRTLLVDDERLARSGLRRLLTEAHPEVEVVGEAANVDEARQEIARAQPELLFLDIQMPGGSGFDLLAALQERIADRGARLPRIIFVTAFDEHALRAFEFGAVDYLLKPVDPKRLAEALGRVISPDGLGPAPVEPLPITRVLGAADRVLVREGERCFFVPLREIRLLESHGNHARVYFAAGSALVPRSLNALETRLDASVFFRANRSQLVNLLCVERVEPWFSDCLLLILTGGQRVEMSRRQSQRFQSLTRL